MFLFDVAAIGERGDLEQRLELLGFADDHDARVDVAYLVGNDAGDFILIVRVGYELAADVNVSPSDGEGVDLFVFVNAECELNRSGRELREQLFADAGELGGIGLGEQGLVGLELVGLGIAQPLLLLGSEDVGLAELEFGGGMVQAVCWAKAESEAAAKARRQETRQVVSMNGPGVLELKHASTGAGKLALVFL